MTNAVIQIINNALVTTIGYSLVASAIFGQFTCLRMVSLSLLTSFIGGAYTANFMYQINGNLFLALLSAIFVGLLLGFIGSIIHLMIGRRQKVLGLLSSLGYFFFIQGLIVIITGGGIKSFNLRFPEILPHGVFGSQPYWLLSGFFILIIVITLNILSFNYSSFGKQVFAIGDDYELGAIFGLFYKKIEIKVQLIGGGIGGIAGTIIALDSGLQPDLGFFIVLKAFAILIVSKEKVFFVPIFAFILAFVENICAYLWGGQLSQAIGLSFVFFIILFKFISKGLLNKKVMRKLQFKG